MMEDNQLQLETVEQALLVANDDTERASLLSLRNDLLELMELTRQTEGLVAETEVENETKNLDNEMQQFMQEIQELDSEAKPANDNKNSANVEAELLELRQQLESMVGEKCSAPHHHSWGATTYHNAIICGIGQTVDADSDGTLGEICLQVLFTNPTHREMLPCTYFLEGECKFDAAKCHYSHGELVPFGDLREYTVPDFEKLARNCVVLAKMEDRLWHRGRVLCSNFMEKQCRVRLDGNQHKVKELDFSFENLFPIYHDEDLSSGSSSNEGTDSESSEELDELEAARRARLVEQSLFTFPANQPLGEWEKHTRGIGSKLMAKMGYIHGTGLGDNGRGIITPISAQILPQGCSLDHCMQLREAANGDKDLFSVEKQLKRKQKKQEAINVKAYERETQRVDVFSFLNDTIFTKAQKSDNIAGKSSVAAKPTSKASIQNQTTKSLNVESVRIADDIRKKEREISKVKESLHRNATSTSGVHKRLQAQLSNMTDELNTLKRAEHSLTKEQAKRKTKDKLCVF